MSYPPLRMGTAMGVPGCSEVLLAGEQSLRAAPGEKIGVSKLCISY